LKKWKHCLTQNERDYYQEMAREAESNYFLQEEQYHEHKNELRRQIHEIKFAEEN